MKTLIRIACAVLLLVMLATPVIAEISSKVRAERAKRLRLALRYLDIAIKSLEDSAALTPELAIAFSEARDGLKELADDVAVIEEQQATFGRLVGDVFPWAAPFLSAGAAYAGGRKHEQQIARKRSTLSSAGRAPGGSATPFTGKAERRPTPQAHPIPVEPSMSEVEGMRDMSTATFEEAMQRKEKP